VCSEIAAGNIVKLLGQGRLHAPEDEIADAAVICSGLKDRTYGR
jgi:hypothetical protein